MCKHRRTIAHTANHNTNIKKKKKRTWKMSTSQYGGICRIYQVGKKGECKAYTVFLCKKEEMRKHTLSLFIWGKRNIGRINQ